MSFKNPETNHDVGNDLNEKIENKNKFYGEFKEKEGQNPDFQKYFGGIIDGAKFDNNKSGEENFKDAFNKKVDSLIDANNNITPERQKKLDKLRELSKGMSVKELLSAYKEIQSVIGTGNAESYDSRDKKAAEDGKQEKTKENDKVKEFIDTIKKILKENAEIEKKKIADAQKQARVNNYATEIQQANADNILDKIPPSDSPAQMA